MINKHPQKMGVPLFIYLTFHVYLKGYAYEY